MASDDPTPGAGNDQPAATAHPSQSAVETGGPPYRTGAMAGAVTDAVSPRTRVTDAGPDAVARSAAFADVATRPKTQAIEHAETVNEVVFYRQLARLDGDLAGTIRAKAQVAAMGPEVTHPGMRGLEEELSPLERRIMEECAALVERLNLDRQTQSFFRRLIIHGNDITHIQYAEGVGVTGVQELPLQAVTITDDHPETTETPLTTGTSDVLDTAGGTLGGSTDMDKTIHDGTWYAVNEDDDDTRQSYRKHEVLHMALNRRANWYTDRLGRDTYGVWGERRLEPVKFAMQAKANTLSNKVALDDSLLAREIYQIDVETLFGHIKNDQERTDKAREYKDKLKAQLNDLAPDEKPILPEEVTVTVEGPDGSTADTQSSFIEMLNNTLQHALTFHSASFGRDAGGSMAGNKPAKEMSDMGVKSLRDAVKDEFRELFRIHTLLTFPEAREPAENPADDQLYDYEQWDLKDEVTLPELTFAPVSRRDKSDRVKDAAAAYEKGVADLNEARAWVDLDPIKEEDIDDMFFRRDPTAMEDPTAPDPGAEGEGGVGREHNESEEDQGQGPDAGQNPNDDGSGEGS